MKAARIILALIIIWSTIHFVKDLNKNRAVVADKIFKSKK